VRCASQKQDGATYDAFVLLNLLCTETSAKKLTKKACIPLWIQALLAFYLYFFLISALAPVDQLSVVDGAADSAGLWFSFFLHIDILNIVSY